MGGAIMGVNADFAGHLTAYLGRWLPGQRNLSPNTIAEPCQYNGQWDPRFYAASIVSGSYARALSKRSKNSSIASAGTRSPMDSCGR